MNLYIDTIEFGKVSFALEDGEKKISKAFKVLPQESDKILVFLGQIFKQAKIRNPKVEIKKIVIYKGQGSFTGLRVGVAIAQALSMAWGVPVKVANKK